MVLHHVWNMKGQLWACATITSKQISLLRGMIRGGERSWLPEEGRPYSHMTLWALTWMWGVVYPVSTCTTTHNRRVAHTCLRPRICFFFIFLNLLSPSGPIKGRARHCMMLLWWPTALVLFWSHVLVVTKFKLLPTFLMLFTYLGSGGWKLLNYLPKPTALPLAKVFKSCRLLSESPRSV